MRLHVLSDLHLEFEPFVAPQTDADVVVLAGDISTGLNGLKWALEAFSSVPVIYVVGNHEFYGHKLQPLIGELRDTARGTNIHLLENEAFSLGDVTFLGATLWTDFALNGDLLMSQVVAQTGMNDYRRIRTLPNYKRLRPSDTRQLHMQSRGWLEEQVFSRKGSQIVIVTHHAPCPRSIPPAFAGDAFNPAFTSDLTNFITMSEARLWVHGHIHSCSDYMVGTTRVLANPRGYPRESRERFRPDLVVEV